LQSPPRIPRLLSRWFWFSEGNKCDLKEEKVVDFSRGREIADLYDIQFFETSAKADINVQEAFGALVDMVCDRMFSGGGESAQSRGRTGSDNDNLSLAHDGHPVPREKSKCCS